jgi:hypothetical protein
MTGFRSALRRGLQAAVKTPSGVVTGANHPQILLRMGRTVPKDRSGSEYGFTNESGQFLSREEAAKVALRT